MNCKLHKILKKVRALFKSIAIIIFSYLVGSISFATIICRNFYSTDIRQYGSKNPGSTNVLRVLGAKPALIVFIADFLKGLIVVLIGRYSGNPNLALLAGLFVVVGHDWPILYNFSGGKGIATSLGVVMGLTPGIGLILIPLGILIIYLTRYVSLCSVVTAITFPILLLAFRYPINYILIGTIIAAIAVYRHKANISRLLSGTENKIGKKIDK